jgi:hypothetical protein
MAVVLLIMITIALFQVPMLLRQKQYRELLGFSMIWLIATVYSLMVVLRVPLPGAVDVLEYIYGRIFELLASNLP